MNHAIESIMMAVGNGAAPTSRSWAVKIVYIAWAVFCVIMLAAYTVSVDHSLFFEFEYALKHIIY
jgi:hypothetical protein